MKKQKIVWFIVAVLLCLVAYGAMYPEKFGVCDADNLSCMELFAYKLGEPLFFISLGLLLSTVVTFFLDEVVFKLWQKIAVAYFVAALLVTTLVPVTCHGLFCFEKENLSQLLGGGLLLVTIILIIYKKLSAKKSLPPQ